MKNIDDSTAAEWLGNLKNIKNEPGYGLFKFHLTSQGNKLGLIICRGKLSARQIREAEVLVSQITLGYEKALLYKRVRKLSRIDGLTGLYLRRYLLERLDEEMKRAKRENYKIAFLMADMDNFKKYNDTYGHPMGDKLLMEAGAIIKENIYGSDFAGRYGGEEFCIYMPMAEKEGTIKKAMKIRKLVEKRTPVTISMGISYFPTDGKNPKELIEAADRALYKAKEAGKNRICELES